MPNLPDIKVNYKIQYYVFQFFGWGFFVFLIGLFNLTDNQITGSLVAFLLVVFVTNFLVSHWYRLIINKYNWILQSIGWLVVRIVLASAVLGVLFSMSISVTRNLLFFQEWSYLNWNDVWFGGLVYFIWSILYFGYLLFYKARKEEFKNMEMLALTSEAELKNLRSQLNPHFMFNAMNSIRALIDEDPEKSKEAVTQLSNVLRSSLVHAKKELAPLQDELALVNDYLSLEKIRYEERLEVITNVDANTLTLLVPPLMIQTLVENGIKHGIAQRIKGGRIEITTFKNSQELIIEIRNTGKLADNQKTETGIGVANTQKRLKLIFGNNAKFELSQEEEMVKSVVIIPLR